MIKKIVIDNNPKHEVFAGHFPGHPVVPAVMMLQWVITEIERQTKVHRVLGIPIAKFRKPISPEDTLIMYTELKSEQIYQFKIICQDKIIADGEVKVEKPQNDFPSS